MRYFISEKANQDIEKIWLYTFENWSCNKSFTPENGH